MLFRSPKLEAPTSEAPERNIIGQIRPDTAVAGASDTEALFKSKKGPLEGVEQVKPEQRGDQFVVVSQDGRPIQGGFRTLEDASVAAQTINSKLENAKEQRKESEKQAKLGQFADIASVLRNPADAPIDMEKFQSRDSWIAGAVNRLRVSQGADERTIASTVTTPRELSQLNVADTESLSNRLLEEQYPGLRAKGLTTPTLGVTGRAEGLLNNIPTINDEIGRAHV